MHGALAHVRFLADDRLEGRAVGSEGARCAAAYIVDQFTSIGLEPAGSGWEVTFDVPQRAVAPGQAAVFYRGDEVLGGGTIAEARP